MYLRRNLLHNFGFIASASVSLSLRLSLHQSKSHYPSGAISWQVSNRSWSTHSEKIQMSIVITRHNTTLYNVSTWFRCAATQGRTKSPDSPNAPRNCSTTATITGNVFYGTEQNNKTRAMTFKLRDWKLELNAKFITTWLATSKTAVAFSFEFFLLPSPETAERMRIETALNASRERCSNL